MRGLLQGLIIITVVLVLVACGGGGGGGSTSATLGPVKKDELVTPPVSNELSKSKDPPSVDTPPVKVDDPAVAKVDPPAPTDNPNNGVVTTDKVVTYADGIQTIKITSSNGSVQTTQNPAKSKIVDWSADHVTKTVTYVFADGTENTVKLTVNPVDQTPVLSRSASYPANWTSGDGSAVVLPLVTAKSKNYGDGFVEIYENGTSEKPFLQSTLIAQSITDPNAVVRASIGNLPAGVNAEAATPGDYDLRWSTPDPKGPGYAARYATGSWQLPSGFTLWGNTLGNGVGRGAVIVKPDAEVMDAWKSGWTGRGVNVMVEDFLNDQHAVVTGLLAMRNAPGASFYGYRVDIENSQKVFDQQLGQIPTAYTGTVKIGVVNSSVVADIEYLIGNKPWSDAALSNAVRNYWDDLTVNRYKDVGQTGHAANFLFSDAVIAKCAGNDRLRSEQEPSNWYIAKDAAIQPRLLIVGALNQSGSVNSPASIAWYSNTAGADADIAKRFLLASGSIPFSGNDVSINGTPLRSGYGTSYAAPRVAGMVAIVRSKFPNLSASQTASIMLDTARYDTLTCYPACDPAIYGRGEASLSRALAPVGKLR